MLRQDDIKKRIFTYYRRLQKLEEQRARHGLDTAPAILMDIEDIEAKIESLETTLEALHNDPELDLPPEIEQELADMTAEKQPSQQTQVTGLNFAGMSGGTINIQGGNIDAGNKETHIHYHGVEETKVPEKPQLPFEPALVEIPEGNFILGADNGQIHEAPSHIVNLPTYKIGIFPVTNAQYAEFIKQTGASISPEAGWELARVGQTPAADTLNHPVVGISWDEAVTYCHWLSEQTGRTYRLPSEAEWEKAARGAVDQRMYPWGQEWDDERANQNGQTTTPVDHYPAQSPYGCYDLVGNVWEWTNTMWGKERAEPDFMYPYPAPNQSDGRESLPDKQRLHREYRLCRGGSFKDKPARLRCTTRARFAADTRHPRRGFRVVQE
ncbi:MAG: formylglycine-generating enzyme family protein [Chloroflexota bacterium]